MQRTEKQNRSMWKWGELLAEEFTNKGMSVQFVLSHAVERQWDKDTVVRLLIKPILKEIAGHESTSKASTTELIQTADVLADHLSQKMGVYLPWPDRHSLAQERRV